MKAWNTLVPILQKLILRKCVRNRLIMYINSGTSCLVMLQITFAKSESRIILNRKIRKNEVYVSVTMDPDFTYEFF